MGFNVVVSIWAFTSWLSGDIGTDAGGVVSGAMV